MKKLTAKSGGELRIGSQYHHLTICSSELIAQFRKQYPDIRLTLLSGNSHEIEDALATGRIDLGMVEGIKRQPTFKYTPFMKDELVAFVHCSNPLAQQEEISLDLLKQTPIVLRELGSGILCYRKSPTGKRHCSQSEYRDEILLCKSPRIKHFVEHSPNEIGKSSASEPSTRVSTNRYSKVLEVENLKMEREFLFVEKRGETAKLQQTFKRFITQGYNA